MKYLLVLLLTGCVAQPPKPIPVKKMLDIRQSNCLEYKQNGDIYLARCEPMDL
jgi:hypothetical protein